MFNIKKPGCENIIKLSVFMKVAKSHPTNFWSSRYFTILTFRLKIIAMTITEK